MRTRLLLPLLTVVLVAACSGGTASSARPAGTNAPASNGAPADTAAPAGGTVDCTKVKAAVAKIGVPLQLLAQMRDPANVAAIKSQLIGDLDVDEFLGALQELHALDGHTSMLGDPKVAIDAYQEAGEAAKTLFATDPVTQDAVDAYNEHVGTVADFLGHQGAIAGAMDDAGC